MGGVTFDVLDALPDEDRALVHEHGVRILSTPRAYRTPEFLERVRRQREAALHAALLVNPE